MKNKKMFVKRERLKEEMLKQRITQSILADYLGISRVQLNKKLMGHVEFTESEISKLKGKFTKAVFSLN